jgi:hypothetical protein
MPCFRAVAFVVENLLALTIVQKSEKSAGRSRFSPPEPFHQKQGAHLNDPCLQK